MSRISEEALIRVETLEKIFNGSLLVYTMNNKKKKEARDKIRARSVWDQQLNENGEEQFRRPKEESAVVPAEIVKVAEDVPEEFKNLVGRTVYVNGLVGKTYWLSANEVEELTWIDTSAVYGLVLEDAE